VRISRTCSKGGGGGKGKLISEFYLLASDAIGR